MIYESGHKGLFCFIAIICGAQLLPLFLQRSNHYLSSKYRKQNCSGHYVLNDELRIKVPLVGQNGVRGFVRYKANFKKKN